VPIILRPTRYQLRRGKGRLSSPSVKWFDKVLGKSSKSVSGPKPDTDSVEAADCYVRLAALLAGYPSHIPVHVGNPLRLSDRQCDENLADLLTQRDDRLQVLLMFLAQQGLDVDAVLEGGTQAAEVFAHINDWLLSWLPKRAFDPVSGDRNPNRPAEKFMASTRSGDDIYLSFISDLALLEGEAIRSTDPRFTWQVYLAPKGLYLWSEEEPEEPGILASESVDERHICLVKQSGDPNYWPTILNVHSLTQACCHSMMSPMGFSGHRFGINYQHALLRQFDQPAI
jgi:hypothetical protein